MNEKEERPSWAELERKHGIPQDVLVQRWQRGDRGDRLVRPAKRFPRPARDPVPKGVFI